MDHEIKSDKNRCEKKNHKGRYMFVDEEHFQANKCLLNRVPSLPEVNKLESLLRFMGT